MGHGQTSEEPPLLREAEASRLDRLPDVDERMAARFCVCSRWAWPVRRTTPSPHKRLSAADAAPHHRHRDPPRRRGRSLSRRWRWGRSR